MGALPVRPDSFEEAIRLNNVNVDENLTAFQWGRIWVADTQYVLDHIQEANSGNSITSLPELPSDIAQRVTELGLKGEELEFVLLFAADILAFQNKKVVDKYVALLQHVIVSSKKLSMSSPVASKFFFANAIPRYSSNGVPGSPHQLKFSTSE